MWLKRKLLTVGEKVIGRLHSASPTEGERFYMYLLLLHVRGATSYDDLKFPHPDFRTAAAALGLTESDTEYALALEEAAALKHPRRLRVLFAHMLMLCDISCVEEL